MKDTIDTLLVLFCTVAIVALIAWGAITVARHISDATDANVAWDQSCRDRGGVPRYERSGRICLRKEMVIDQ